MNRMKYMIIACGLVLDPVNALQIAERFAMSRSAWR